MTVKVMGAGRKARPFPFALMPTCTPTGLRGRIEFAAGEGG